MLLDLRNDIADSLVHSLSETGLAEFEQSEFIQEGFIEVNDFDEEGKGELASPIPFRIAADRDESPNEIAERILQNQRYHSFPPEISGTSIEGGYINYHVDHEAFATETLRNIRTSNHYGANTAEDPERIVVDVSAPNICKPLHIGHVRNTFLGIALANILRTRGHDVITDNHLGDWGVQFGHLMYEFKNHGDEEAFEENPIAHLLELYQKFGQREAELDEAGKEEELEELRDRGREWFARTENRDPEAYALWRRFWEASVERFEDTYERMGVDFDVWLGESYYALYGWNETVIENALDRDAAIETDEGVVFVPVYPDDLENVEDADGFDIDTSLNRAIQSLLKERSGQEDDQDSEVEQFVLVKSDGSTTYGTRDIAAIEYRRQEFDADRSVYVVASEQDEYFQNMFAAARKLGYTDMDFKHASYGMITLPEGSMSTRMGNIITAQEILETAYDRAYDVVDENRPELPEETKAQIAEQVTLATVKFENVSTSRGKDVTFDLENAISFQGATGPYLQYSATRALNIINEVEEIPSLSEVDDRHFNRTDHQLVYQLSKYPLVLERCELKYDAAPLANYLIRLAQDFNSFYHDNRVLDAEHAREERLVLTASTYDVFENALDLLGIEIPAKM